MGGAGDLRHFARQGAHALLQRLLLAGQGLGPLRRLERQRARLSGPRGGRPRTTGRGLTRALLRQRARALAQGALLRRARIGRPPRAPRPPRARRPRTGAAPSSGAPSAAVRSSRHVPEVAGSSRPEKRAPSTASRDAGPRPAWLHAARASATLAEPLVRISVPAGIGTVSAPETSGSSARAR